MKKKTAVVVLCVCFVLCMSVSMQVQGKAEDAFVVEEEVIIGGEDPQESKIHSIPAVLSNEISEPEKNASELKEEKEAPQKKNSKRQEEDQEQETTVSTNSVASVFRVPVRRQQTKQKKQDMNEQEAEEQEVQEHGMTEELSTPIPEQEPGEKEENSWWMLIIAGFFCLGGCISVFLRWKGRKN